MRQQYACQYGATQYTGRQYPSTQSVMPPFTWGQQFSSYPSTQLTWQQQQPPYWSQNRYPTPSTYSQQPPQQRTRDEWSTLKPVDVSFFEKNILNIFIYCLAM